MDFIMLQQRKQSRHGGYDGDQTQRGEKMEIAIASVICSIIASIVTSLIITRESLNIMRDEADRVFKMNLNFVRDVVNMLADRFGTTRK